MSLSADSELVFCVTGDSYITQDFTATADMLFAANGAMALLINANSSGTTETIRFLGAATERAKFTSDNALEVQGTFRLKAGNALSFNTGMTTAIYRDSGAATLRFKANGTVAMRIDDSGGEDQIRITQPVVCSKLLKAHETAYGMRIPTFTSPPSDPQTGDIFIRSDPEHGIYRVYAYFGASDGAWYYAELT